MSTYHDLLDKDPIDQIGDKSKYVIFWYGPRVHQVVVDEYDIEGNQVVGYDTSTTPYTALIQFNADDSWIAIALSRQDVVPSDQSLARTAQRMRSMAKLEEELMPKPTTELGKGQGQYL